MFERQDIRHLSHPLQHTVDSLAESYVESVFSANIFPVFLVLQQHFLKTLVNQNQFVINQKSSKISLFSLSSGN